MCHFPKRRQTFGVALNHRKRKHFKLFYISFVCFVLTYMMLFIWDSFIWIYCKQMTFQNNLHLLFWAYIVSGFFLESDILEFHQLCGRPYRFIQSQHISGLLLIFERINDGSPYSRIDLFRNYMLNTGFANGEKNKQKNYMWKSKTTLKKIIIELMECYQKSVGPLFSAALWLANLHSGGVVYSVW